MVNPEINEKCTTKIKGFGV